MKQVKVRMKNVIMKNETSTRMKNVIMKQPSECE